MILKRVLLSLSIIGALVVSQAASADNRNHRRGFGDYGYSQHNNRYRSGYRGNRRVNSYHYGSPRRDYRNYNRRYRSGFNFSYGNYYSRHRRYDSGSFVGGLVLGSLFSYPRYNSRHTETVIYREAPVTRTREIVTVAQPRTTTAPVASGRRLLRDLEGNCFERIVDEQGDEIRVQLEAQECNF
ncbi:MAG: hypothetical protein DHS20C12_18920 [Pseudohongiella sp.]|nr:MAG: hypothetical protein DHS20C12_18920 [Pseudohongiella sp.]